MIYRHALVEDIPQIMNLQQKYHISTIAEADKADGFVTTLFTEAQFKELIETENGISLALDEDQVVAYAMAASWEFWSSWPLFQQMISDLPNITYGNISLNTENSYQYGPICIDKAYRGSYVLSNVFDLSASQMRKRYQILITFINQINPRSYAAHVNKLKLDLIKEFDFNNNHYFELALDLRDWKSSNYTVFTKNVIKVIKEIPSGKVSTYGHVAKAAGHPGAARQVVRILHALSDKENLPWHRVVRKDGTIALTGEGAIIQVLLLEKEGVSFISETQVNMKKHQL